jgi:SNF2-related domain
MTLDFSRCRLPPFQHQREDVAWLLERPYALIASEMRTGKSKIVVDAAQFLFERGDIDRMIVVAPAPVRDVWYDPTLGELAKHLWVDTRAEIVEFHARLRNWSHGPIEKRALTIYVTNFEFLRSSARLNELLAVVNAKTLLVLDESSFVKNHAAQQTKACLALRRKCGRVVLLNGTPIFHSPMDLFSQGNLMHESIIGTRFITYFKGRYALQTPVLERGKPMIRYGKIVQRVSGWTNLDDLERRFKPYTVRRLQAECLDLPPKLDPVTLTAVLTPETWRAYKAMRDDLVVWLSSGDVATSATAAAKAMRLSQITGGFLGGVEEANIGTEVDEGLLESLLLGGINGDGYSRNVTGDPRAAEEHQRAPEADGQTAEVGTELGCQSTPTGLGHVAYHAILEVGREKLDVLLWFIAERLEADPNLHLVAWGRFRAEVLRAVNVVHSQFPQFECGVIMGGQKKAERLAALALLKPETSPTGPVFVAGIEGTGSFGLDMTAAHTCVTMSSGYSPGRSAQTLDRVYGPGQKFPIAYYDIVAVGPKGQHTIDRDILVARRSGEDVATRTAAAWVRALKMEE